MTIGIYQIKLNVWQSLDHHRKGNIIKPNEWSKTEQILTKSNTIIETMTEHEGRIVFDKTQDTTKWLSNLQSVARYIKMALYNDLIQRDNHYTSPHLINNFCSLHYQNINLRLMYVTNHESKIKDITETCDVVGFISHFSLG